MKTRNEYKVKNNRGSLISFHTQGNCPSSEENTQRIRNGTSRAITEWEWHRLPSMNGDFDADDDISS